MALERKDIEHIAALAHLKLDECGVEKFREQLSNILEYVGSLSKVDTRDVEPASHVTGVRNGLRDDNVVSCDQSVRDELIKAAAQQERGYIKVKNVF